LLTAFSISIYLSRFSIKISDPEVHIFHYLIVVRLKGKTSSFFTKPFREQWKPLLTKAVSRQWYYFSRLIFLFFFSKTILFWRLNRSYFIYISSWVTIGYQSFCWVLADTETVKFVFTIFDGNILKRKSVQCSSIFSINLHNVSFIKF